MQNKLQNTLHTNPANIVRWYVLQFPARHKGGVKGLTSEELRRKKYDLPPLEYFWPTCVEKIKRNGKWVTTSRALYYNYIFVHASENEIYEMKRSSFKIFSFLPRVRTKEMDFYPYIPDNQMDNLKWISRSYADEIPFFFPKTGKLLRGDRIRITEGQFKGVEATVAIQPGAGKKDIMVCIENWMWVPLLHIQPGQYEIISLNDSRKHVYTNLDNERISCGLHEALGRYHAPGGVNEADRALASEALRLYEGLEMPTDVMRCKLYSILLPAYTVLGDKENAASLAATMHSILPVVKAEQSRALLLVTLYGCTDSSIYHGLAHALVSPWRRESNPKKSKRQLLQRLDDYDRWLGH